ncbi:MAG: sigma-70 family RNA polymerase sigma factor [Siphonobacter aquaeclarae]|jgi:RNA polymerase sigma factor (sigma-70 family)|nr:sigma-70 family RNA polymerase sigma factor [Siphonobacter aquaeclarae]
MAKLVPHDEALMAELWVRFKAGDEQAFDLLTEKRYRTLFNYATRFSKDREFIKDCIQDLFLELWNRRQTIVTTPYVTIYLIKSLRNNLLRKQKQLRQWEFSQDEWDGEWSDGWTVEEEWISSEFTHESQASLRQAIQALPRRQQEVIFLKFYEGLSNEAIAQVMEVENQTVANFLYRALSQLRNTMPALVRVLAFFLFFP